MPDGTFRYLLEFIIHLEEGHPCNDEPTSFKADQPDLSVMLGKQLLKAFYSENAI